LRKEREEEEEEEEEVGAEGGDEHFPREEEEAEEEEEEEEEEPRPTRVERELRMEAAAEEDLFVNLLSLAASEETPCRLATVSTRSTLLWR